MLHRAELGGDGAAGAAGDHDRGQERRDLAQRQDADEVDGEDGGAEDSCSWKAPCWAMMPPIRNDISTMIGTARTPASSICRPTAEAAEGRRPHE